MEQKIQKFLTIYQMVNPKAGRAAICIAKQKDRSERSNCPELGARSRKHPWRAEICIAKCIQLKYQLCSECVMLSNFEGRPTGSCQGTRFSQTKQKTIPLHCNARCLVGFLPPSAHTQVCYAKHKQHTLTWLLHSVDGQNFASIVSSLAAWCILLHTGW